MTDAPTAVVVLAAGEGTRMKSAIPKVLHPIAGRSLLGHVLAAAEPLAATHTLVVIGAGRQQVSEHLAQVAPLARTVVQEERLGSGHATRLATDSVPDLTGTVLVLNGDVPLLTTDTLAGLLEAHGKGGHAMTVLSAVVPDPTGLGRIIRDSEGGVRAIVEHKDADAQQHRICEINAGAYAFDAETLREALSKVSTDNVQGEEYLTEVLSLLVTAGRAVGAYVAEDHVETLGCNDRVELAERRRQLNDRLLTAWMRAGVTVVDPSSTWVDVDVVLEPDVTLHPNVQLQGATKIARGAAVGPDSTLIDTVVGEDATVIRVHTVQAEIGPKATVGPYTYLRPGTKLRKGSKAGTFVEMKNADIGEGTKVPHLSYVGDATVGEFSNIGASSVVVNYDGVTKHHTTIGSHVRTGSDNTFVAPVSVGDGAYTGAGAVIREDVPPGALAVSSGAVQRTIEGWVERRRPGTKAADAAAAARSAATEAGSEDTPDGPRTPDPGQEKPVTT